jgi:type IV pilus assembly protein PilY1
MRRQYGSIRGRSSLRWLWGSAAGLAALAIPSAARAQVSSASDAVQPLPNVLLLLDTAGSMELMMDGTTPEAGGGTCPTAYASGMTYPTANRWGTQLQALTGDLTTYSCIDMSRSLGSAFDQEFSYWGGNPPDMGTPGSSQTHPYDLDYYIDFHRPAYPITDSSGNPTGKLCAISFDQSSSTGWSTLSAVNHAQGQTEFAKARIQGYQFNPDGTPYLSAGKLQTCTFNQAPNGLLDQAGSAVRFALMTIDSDTNQRIGVTTSGSGSTQTFAEIAGTTGTSPDPAIIDLTTGMWSYFNGWNVSGSTYASRGRPAGCTTSPAPYFEVGARNSDAPPWEGPLVGFPSSPSATPDPDPSATNAMVRQAILAMRPYGANPIAGMLDDAKNYYWVDPQGPSGAGQDALAGCRKSYIILLSHAAPNLDLATNISSTATCRASYGGGDAGVSANGICPYDYPEAIAGGLATGTYTPTVSANLASSTTQTGNPVTTFVIGFSLSSGLPNGGGACTDILTGTAPNYTGFDKSKCGDIGQPVTTGYAQYSSCCDLAKIAAQGGSSYPYFADNQQDLESAFAAILAIVKAGSTTRATPVTMPQTANTLYSDGSLHGAVSATFLSSFQPSTVTPWSGDVQRQRYQCVQGSGGGWAQQGQKIDLTAGDDFANNIDSSPAVTRHLMVVYPTGVGYPDLKTASSSTLRSWVAGNSTSNTGTAFDNMNMSDGTELMYSYQMSGTGTTSVVPTTGSFTPAALFGSGTCPVSNPKTNVAFNQTDCQAIAFDWVMGTQSGPTSWPSSFQAFPARYTGGTANSSFSAFGGVFHSTPSIATPPNALLQDDSYQSYVTAYSQSFTQSSANNQSEPRHTMLYVATIDGMLHAFGADYDANDSYTFNGANGGAGKMNELWAFIPPAVMPHLLDAFPKGQTALLDGAPVTKDVVFERFHVGSYDDWHTSLVAGFGPAGTVTGGGYYALDVTDPEAADHVTSPGLAPAHSTANSGTAHYIDTTKAPPTNHHPVGPHFLWQLTGQDTTNGLNYFFGKYSATPAITTLVMDPDGNGKREVGVAILPGGTSYTGPLSATTSCTRSLKVTTATPTGYDLGRTYRNWSADPQTGGTGCIHTPVAGRSVSIVRMDTGEVIRTFANLTGPDLTDSSGTTLLTSTAVKLFGANLGSSSGSNAGTNGAGYRYQGRVTDARFDSPMTGTPVPYPSDVGAAAQRIFIGDQDGTIWRIDVTSTNPNEWFVEPFYDSFNLQVQSSAQAPVGATNDTTWALDRRPVVDAPRVSVGRTGNLVLNWGTGELANLGLSDGSYNYVFSAGEVNSTSSINSKLVAKTNWFEALQTGEMVSGPSLVFDSVYYFTTYVPSTTSGRTCSPGASYIWGVDYEFATDSNHSFPAPTPPTIPSFGGVPELQSGTGSSLSHQQSINTLTGVILPGVAVTSTAACATDTSVPDPYTGGSRFSMQNISPATYSVQALAGTAPAAGNNLTAPTQSKVSEYNYTLTNGPRSITLVDSWASIVE